MASVDAPRENASGDGRVSDHDTALTTIPATLSIGEERMLTLGDEEVVAVGSAPSGYTVLLLAADWAALKRWKFTHLRIQRGSVYVRHARSGGMAARFLTGTDYDGSVVILFRNRNRLDLRRSNIVVVPRSTYLNAKRTDATRPDATAFKDGRKRPWNFVSASERLEKLVNG